MCRFLSKVLRNEPGASKTRFVSISSMQKMSHEPPRLDVYTCPVEVLRNEPGAPKARYV